MAWDDNKSSVNLIKSDDWNAMVAALKARASSMTLEQFSGSDCSGSDGDNNRVLTTTGAGDALGNMMVFLDGTLVRKTDEFTISDDDITFSIKVWDSQKIDVYYLVSS